MTKQTTPSITPMLLTGEAITSLIRRGTDVADLVSLDPEQLEAVRNGSASITGDSARNNFTFVRPPEN